MKTKEQQKEKILDSLYRHCSLITNSASDVAEKLMTELKVYPPNEVKDKVLNVVREYKKTRTGLEATVEELHNLLYPPPLETPKEKQHDPDNWESF